MQSLFDWFTSLNATLGKLVISLFYEFNSCLNVHLRDPGCYSWQTSNEDRNDLIGGHISKETNYRKCVSSKQSTGIDDDCISTGVKAVTYGLIPVCSRDMRERESSIRKSRWNFVEQKSYVNVLGKLSISCFY